ncbi:MAG: integrase arm-type DNA-binding domain-containing protein, partial [Proteobacteria bacterium]|nr:integrase arm-type DNA-binding domain-containing protein [Pseudomonadota bacterium]
MPKIRLMARTIDRLDAPGSGHIDYWDEALPGFGLRVSQGGRKAWVVMYRVRGRKRRLTLGTYPPMPLVDARAKAKAAMVRVQGGADPAEEKRVESDALTFSRVADEYLERYAKPRKKSWRADEKVLQRDLLPRFEHRRIAEITRRDIRDIVNAIKARGAPIQANRTFEIVRKLFNWAVAEDYLDRSPCVGLSKPAKENRRDRVLTEDEIRRVWRAIEAEQPLISSLFKLRLITAQRGGEIASMRWEEIEFASGWWTIPGERTKNGLTHRVPISNQAQTVLDELNMQRDGDQPNKQPDNSSWVFPSPLPDRHLEFLVQAAHRIRDRAGIDFV